MTNKTNNQTKQLTSTEKAFIRFVQKWGTYGRYYFYDEAHECLNIEVKNNSENIQQMIVTRGTSNAIIYTAEYNYLKNKWETQEGEFKMKQNNQTKTCNHTFFQTKDTEHNNVWECWNCGILDHNITQEDEVKK